MSKKMDHVTYPKTLKRKSVEQLRFIIKDASEARDAFPMGENSGYYADEVHYASMELQRRG